MSTVQKRYKLTALNLDLNLSKLFSSLISFAKSLKIKAPCIAKRFLPDSVLDLGMVVSIVIDFLLCSLHDLLLGIDFQRF
mgnify:FL=1